jgi:cytoskeletal protein RodZ
MDSMVAQPPAEPQKAVARRDAGIRKISRLTAWVLAGSVALAGVLSEVAAQAVPGHAKRAQRTSTTHRSAASHKSASPSSSSSSSNSSSATGNSTLQAPSQTPAPSSGSGSGSGSGSSVSGGS